MPVLICGLSVESEWQQVSRTLLRIITKLYNALIHMALILPLISKFSSLLSKPLGIVLSALGIIVTFMFHSFLFFLGLWQDLSICLTLCFLLFWLCHRLEQQNSPDDKLSFSSNSTRFGLLAGITRSVYISNSQRILCFTLSKMDSI